MILFSYNSKLDGCQIGSKICLNFRRTYKDHNIFGRVRVAESIFIFLWEKIDDNVIVKNNTSIANLKAHRITLITFTDKQNDGSLKWNW